MLRLLFTSLVVLAVLVVGWAPGILAQEEPTVMDLIGSLQDRVSALEDTETDLALQVERLESLVVILWSQAISLDPELEEQVEAISAPTTLEVKEWLEQAEGEALPVYDPQELYELKEGNALRFNRDLGEQQIAVVGLVESVSLSTQYSKINLTVEGRTYYYLNGCQVDRSLDDQVADLVPGMPLIVIGTVQINTSFLIVLEDCTFLRVNEMAPAEEP